MGAANGDAKRRGTVALRKSGQKKTIVAAILEFASREYARRKAGIDYSTLCRWEDEDPNFRDAVREALARGHGRVDDWAQSNVIKGIFGGDKEYTMYYLNRRNPDYQLPRPPAVPAKESPVTPELARQIHRAALAWSERGDAVAAQVEQPRVKDPTKKPKEAGGEVMTESKGVPKDN